MELWTGEGRQVRPSSVAIPYCDDFCTMLRLAPERIYQMSHPSERRFPGETDHFVIKDLIRQKYKKETGITKDILVETTSSNLIRQKYKKEKQALTFIRQKYKVKS
jgi:hypothetical protein